MKESTIIARLLPLLKSYSWAVPLIVTLGMLASIFEGLGISLFIPVLQRLMQNSEAEPINNVLIRLLLNIIDGIFPYQVVWVLPALILGCIIVKNLLSYTNHVFSAWLQARISHRLRSQVFHQLLYVSYSHLETQDSGKLMNTLSGETWRTGQALAQLLNLLTTICTTFVYIVILMLISWRLTLLVGLIMGIISLVIQGVTRRIASLGKKAVKSNANLGIRMYEGLIGMRTIRAFGNEQHEQGLFNRTSRQVEKAMLKLDVLSGTVQPLYEVLSALLVLSILVVAVQNDRSFLPILLTFLFMLYRLQPLMQQIDGYRTNLQALSASVEDVFTFLNTDDKPFVKPGTVPFKGLQHQIEFSSVSFSYHAQETPALDHISLKIPARKTTALVGPSGAGKSTLINLICRFYEPTEGSILVDRQCLRSLKLKDWLNRIAIVSQDIHIFNANLLENIAYGCLNATSDDIIAAARQANAHDFIAQMPQGYETRVGDRGMRLSGGQRQRIALARAIVRNPDILILDEATNALDSISEHLIQESLELFSRDRTVIVIAHRLSTIDHAEQIVVLHEGKIAEIGTREDLMNQDGLFSQMYRLQNRMLTL